jgi:dihydroorotate dehydrogenase (fumarate)
VKALFKFARKYMPQIMPNEVDLSTTIAGIKVPKFVIGPATGVRDTTEEELHILGASKSVSVIPMKTATLSPRKGNEEPRLTVLPDGSCLQSMGLPNLGIPAYLKIIPALLQYRKPIFGNISADSPEGFEKLVDMYRGTGISMLTLNISCPNKGGPMICYNMHDLQVTLMRNQKRADVPINLKLPPYNDPWQQEFVVGVAIDYGVDCLTLINGVGRCLEIDIETEAPVLRATKGFAAEGGAHTRRQMLGNIRSVYTHKKAKRGKFSIIATGGISTGKHAFQALLAGADAAKVGTILLNPNGPTDFSPIDRINNELAEILAAKGYRSIAEAKGKLKPYGE